MAPSPWRWQWAGFCRYRWHLPARSRSRRHCGPSSRRMPKQTRPTPPLRPSATDARPYQRRGGGRRGRRHSRLRHPAPARRVSRTRSQGPPVRHRERPPGADLQVRRRARPPRLERLAGAKPGTLIDPPPQRRHTDRERALLRQAETRYRRFVSDRQASTPSTGGAGATPERASQRSSKDKAAQHPKPQGLRFATSVTHAQTRVSHHQ
jgi:hypothetical protein